MSYKLISPPVFTVLLQVSAFLFQGCHSKKQPNAIDQPIESEYLIKGKVLAEEYCGSCHLYPAPSLLDKKSWANVLPVMENEMSKNAMSINSFDWIILQDYYNKAAPQALQEPPYEKLTEENKLFSQMELKEELPSTPPAVTLVKYDDPNKIFCVGDVSGNLFLLQSGHIVRDFAIDNIPIDVRMDGNKNLEVLGIGTILPSEEKKGKLMRIDSAGNQVVLIDSLKRPVHFTCLDFNSDGRDEYLISCFGSTIGRTNSGRLSMYSYEDKHYREIVIKEMPGPVKTIANDFDNDGRQDFIALFSQARESIILFLNKGNLEFEERTLLEFPPVYGSNDFQLADMNGDTFLDIIYTNGDNSDYSPIYKPYHGVRVFINNGRNEFKEEFFFHIDGASRVIVSDFDSDNYRDMVVLAMYPNLDERAVETLVYFQNKGNGHFMPSYIEQEPSGKWLLADAGDIDGDGDKDLLVGANLLLPSAVPLPPYYEKKWNSTKRTYMVLVNNSTTENSHKSVWQKILDIFK